MSDPKRRIVKLLRRKEKSLAKQADTLLREETAALQPATGTELAVTPFGVSLGARNFGQVFSHPFYPALGPTGIVFSRGLVSGIEPVIGTGQSAVPISGLVTGPTGTTPVQKPQPVLKLDPSIVTAGDNRSWACVEVTPGPTGIGDAATVVEVVHRATAFLNSPTIGRQPLCLILWNNKSPSQVFHIAYFNMTCVMVTVAAGTGTGVVKFFFL